MKTNRVVKIGGAVALYILVQRATDSILIHYRRYTYMQYYS